MAEAKVLWLERTWYSKSGLQERGIPAAEAGSCGLGWQESLDAVWKAMLSSVDG